MTSTKYSHKILEALENIEHPAIAATLMKLGMLRHIEVSSDKKVELTMVLPFPSIPENVRDYMINRLASAARSAGGELTKVNIAVMNEEERQKFLTIEQEFWRG
ncbi:MAG: iron-sulfur cluster assembly protein [Anaerolineales bacterium]